jgi:hypothetical protein
MASDGVVNSLAQTGVLLVAIAAFSASDGLKSILGSAPHFGQLSALFLTAALAGTAIRPSLVAGVLGIVAAGGLFAASFTTRAGAFTVFVTLTMMMVQLRIPFIAAIHERNYPAVRRGRRFSLGMVLLLIVALGFDLLSGRILEDNVLRYRVLLQTASAIVFAGSVALLFVPSRPSPIAGSRNPFRNLAILKTDRLFRRLLIAWFIMGFANLLTVPLRVVYLAEAERGLGLSPLMVMLIGGVLPQATRLVFSRIWARIFDRMHLVWTRMLLTTLMGFGIFLFFSTRLIPVVIAGQFILNVAFAGGPILWNLWVTRIAPPGKTSIYMSIHAFFTGIRGSIAPAIGFLAIAGLSFRLIGSISFALCLIAVASVIPLRTEPRGSAPTSAE